VNPSRAQGRDIASILGERSLAFDPATLLQEIDKVPRPPEWYRVRAIEFASLQQKCQSIIAPEHLSTLSHEIFSASHSSAPEGKLQAILAREQNVIASVLAIHKEVLRNQKMLHEGIERANNKGNPPGFITSVDREIKRIDDLAEQLGLNP
jgi:hypothetical protein